MWLPLTDKPPAHSLAATGVWLAQPASCHHPAEQSHARPDLHVQPTAQRHGCTLWWRGWGCVMLFHHPVFDKLSSYNNRLFVAPRLVRAQSAQKDIRILSLHHTHTHTHTHARVHTHTISLSHTHTHAISLTNTHYKYVYCEILFKDYLNFSKNEQKEFMGCMEALLIGEDS